MIATWLIRPRQPGLLLAIGLIIGIAHALTLLPIATALGQGAFWEFPRGTINGSENDFAQVLDGYLHFQLDTWHWPLLMMSHVVPPSGTNLFWLDAVPWVSMLGKILFDLTGLRMNLLGPFQFACFALPGMSIAAVLVAFEQRSLLATVAGAALVVAMPFHLVEWGHVALCGQFLILLALALYGMSVRNRPSDHLGLMWFTLLALALLTNLYLFAMAGVIWVATLAQRGLNGVDTRRLGIEAAATTVMIVAIMAVTGILTPDLRSAGSGGFGEFSLNLGSPFIPQNSGVIAPLAHYLIGGRVQVSGYLGLGVLLALAVAAITSMRSWWRAGRRHSALLVLLGACYLFALSYRITLGNHVLLELPLPQSLVYSLGTFRSSGRFFWPIGYALVVLAVVTIAHRFRPPVAALMLTIACVLQWVDVNPIRVAIARTSSVPAPPAIDRRQAELLAVNVQALALYPSFGCVPAADPPTAAAMETDRLLHRRAMEFHLVAARRDLAINSVDNSRLATDCIAEAAERGKPLRAGILYVYLDGILPDIAQFRGADPANACHPLGDVRACKIAND